MEFNSYILKDICDIQIGRTPPRAESKWFNSGSQNDFLWASIKDMGECSKFICKTNETLTKEAQERFNVPIVEKGTILLSFKLTVGRVAIAEQNMLTNEAIAQLKIKDDTVVDRDYLYYLLKNYPWKTLGSTSSIATAVNSTMIKNMVIELPSIKEQKKIASILNKVDNKIETNLKVIENISAQIECLYNIYFRYKTTDSLPSGWKLLKLKDVTLNIRDKCGSNNFKVFSALNIGVLSLSEEYFSKQVYSKDISNYIKVEPLDFAYNPARVNIGSIGINDKGYTGCVSPVYVVFRVEEGYHNFFNLFIKSNQFKSEAILRASGSVRQTLNYTDFGLIDIIYPPKNIVYDFNNKYGKLSDLIGTILKENMTLNEIKKSLMLELFDKDKVENIIK